MRVLFLTRYSVNGASSRCRCFQYFPWLERSGIRCTVRPLYSEKYLTMKYSGRHRIWRLIGAAWSILKRLAGALSFGRYDAIVLEKELFPYFPYAIEALILHFSPKLLIDYDDAMWVPYRNIPILRKKIGRLMARANAISAGSEGILSEAARYNPHVFKLPTTVDTSAYPTRNHINASTLDHGPTPLLVVWVGTPITSMFLDECLPALERAAQELPMRLVCIGGQLARKPDKLDVTFVPWNPDTVAAELAKCDVGIMPLPDSEYTRGKCAYKLIQYMAAGLPTIASEVGENPKAIMHGITGYICSKPQEWVDALKTLFASPSLRASMGKAGRQRAEALYDIRPNASRLLSIIRDLGDGYTQRESPPCSDLNQTSPKHSPNDQI